MFSLFFNIYNLKNPLFRRKQSGDGDSDSLCEKLKVGAFASRTAAGSAGEGESAAAAESTDQLLQLFSRRSEPDDNLEKKEDKEVEIYSQNSKGFEKAFSDLPEFNFTG